MGSENGPVESALDDSGFDWDTNQNRTPRSVTAGKLFLERTRRTRSRAGTLGAAGLVTLIALLLVSGQSVAHTSFTANDVAVVGNAGQLTSLTIAPEGDVHYDGLEAEPASVEIVVSVRESGSSSWDAVGEKTLAATGREGDVTFSFDEIDVLGESSLKRADFTPADGTTESTDVDVKLDVVLVGAGPSGGDVTTTATDTMTVSVTNEPAGGNVGGNANAGGSAA